MAVKYKVFIIALSIILASMLYFFVDLLAWSGKAVSKPTDCSLLKDDYSDSCYFRQAISSLQGAMCTRISSRDLAKECLTQIAERRGYNKICSPVDIERRGQIKTVIICQDKGENKVEDYQLKKYIEERIGSTGVCSI
jgi:hypothetical protein